MDWNVIVDFVLQQGIWCALFVWLFFSCRKEAKEREETLYDVVQEQGEKLQEISNTLGSMNERMEQIEEAIK